MSPPTALWGAFPHPALPALPVTGNARNCSFLPSPMQTQAAVFLCATSRLRELTSPWLWEGKNLLPCTEGRYGEILVHNILHQRPAKFNFTRAINNEYLSPGSLASTRHRDAAWRKPAGKATPGKIEMPNFTHQTPIYPELEPKESHFHSLKSAPMKTAAMKPIRSFKSRRLSPLPGAVCFCFAHFWSNQHLTECLEQ